MGLDTVELVIEIEEKFGVSIPDGVAEQMVTVGELFDWVLKRIAFRESCACPSATAFYQFRRAALNWLPVDRRSIRPDTSLAEFLPVTTRKQVWQGIARAFDWNLPRLEPPTWTRHLTAAMVLLVPSLALLTWSHFRFAKEMLPSVLFVSVVGTSCFSLLALFVRSSTAIEFPRECQTVRAVIGFALRNELAFDTSQGSLDSAAVWESLRSIIVEALGVKPEQVTRSAQFVKDLGVG